jgi:hypothetical protein
MYSPSISAGLTGGIVDRLVETKGVRHPPDYIEAESDLDE